MKRIVLLGVLACLPLTAHAWFFFLPIGAIARALETDPDKVVASEADRNVGRCAGLHVNQSNLNNKTDEEKAFHQAAAEKVVLQATDKDAAKKLADAYSTRWSRAAGVDAATNRSYGVTLATACRNLNAHVTLAEQKMKIVEDERRQQEQALLAKMAQDREAARIEEQKVADETRQREASLQKVVATTTNPQPGQIDFAAEAHKSARILGCIANEAKVVGVADRNILFSVACQSGGALSLTCDPSGLCLKR